MRGVDRERLMRSFPGREIHIFTELEDIKKWKENLSGFSVEFHEAVPFLETTKIMAQSNGVLHSVPVYREAYHERLLLALSVGTTVVSSASLSLSTFLEEAGAMVSYTTSSLPTVADRLEKAQTPQKNYQQILEWLQHQTWDARLDQHLPEISRLVEQKKRKHKAG